MWLQWEESEVDEVSFVCMFEKRNKEKTTSLWWRDHRQMSGKVACRWEEEEKLWIDDCRCMAVCRTHWQTFPSGQYEETGIQPTTVLQKSYYTVYLRAGTVLSSASLLSKWRLLKVFKDFLLLSHLLFLNKDYFLCTQRKLSNTFNRFPLVRMPSDQTVHVPTHV